MPEMNRDEIAKLEALYASNPEGRVFTHLAEAYRKAGEFDRARAILEQGLGKHPGYASAYVVLGRVFFDLNDTEQATDSFRRVLQLDPHNMVALRTLGDIARAAGRRDEALEHFQELRHQDPGNLEIEAIITELRQAPAAPPEPLVAEPEEAPFEPAGETQESWDAPPAAETETAGSFEEDSPGPEEEPLAAVADNLPEFDATPSDYSELVAPDIDIDWTAAAGETVQDEPLPGDLADYASLVFNPAHQAPADDDAADEPVFDISDLEPEPDFASTADSLPEFLADVSLEEPEPEPTPDAFVPEPEAVVPEPEPEAELEPAPAAEVVTETMALLYRDQGLYERSAEIYRALLRERPGDWSLQAGLHEVERLATDQQFAAPAGLEQPAPEAPPSPDEQTDDDAPSQFQPTAPEAIQEPAIAETEEEPASPWVYGGAGVSAEAPSLYSLAEEERDEETSGAPITDYFRSLLSWRPSGNGAPQSSFAPAPEAEAEPAMLELDLPADSADEPLFEEPVLPTEPERPSEEPAAPVRTAQHLPPAIPADELMPWEEPASPSMPDALPVAPPAPAAPRPPVQNQSSDNPVDAAFDEWFNSSPPSPESAFDPLPSLTPPVPPPAPSAGTPTMPLMPMESDAAGGEDDDDLEMFRSWLQSLKK